MKPQQIDIKFFPVSQLKKIAALHVTKFKRRVTRDGLDKNGNPFPEYSEAYLEFLRNDGKEEGKRRGDVAGVSLTVNPEKIAKRQFILRGLTMRNFRVREVRQDSYTLGWDDEAAGIVEANANRRKKRDIIGVPESEMNWVVDQLGGLVDKEFEKFKDVTIKVG